MIDSQVAVPLEKSSERVLGEIGVTAKLSMGFQRLSLFFTDQRIIASHRSKIGAGGVAPTFMFGSLGNTLGSLFSRKKGSPARSKSEGSSPMRILAADKSNFSIFFEEIVSVDLIRGTYKNSITLLSKTDKYDFSSTTRFDHVRRLFQDALGGKVRLHSESETLFDLRDKSDKPISHRRT